MVLYDSIGEVLQDQGKLEEALEDYEQWMAICKRLADQDKTNSDWKWSLSFSYQKWATCWRL